MAKNIKVIGIGGIGCQFIPNLSRYLNYKKEDEEIMITLIDGDNYEEKNKDRQTFNTLGNKASVMKEKLEKEFPRLVFNSHEEYVTPDSAEYMLGENDIIVLCVDNHKTRKLVSDYCSNLENIVVISGGNEYTDGNVQVYMRKNHTDVTTPLASEYHEEILHPQDKSPHEMSCEELAASEPQLFLTNNAISTTMLNAYYSIEQGGCEYEEVYVDILTNQSQSVNRKKK